MYHCKYFNCDRLGFYGVIHTIFGTVHRHLHGSTKNSESGMVAFFSPLSIIFYNLQEDTFENVH